MYSSSASQASSSSESTIRQEDIVAFGEVSWAASMQPVLSPEVSPRKSSDKAPEQTPPGVEPFPTFDPAVEPSDIQSFGPRPSDLSARGLLSTSAQGTTYVGNSTSMAALGLGPSQGYQFGAGPSGPSVKESFSKVDSAHSSNNDTDMSGGPHAHGKLPVDMKDRKVLVGPLSVMRSQIAKEPNKAPFGAFLDRVCPEGGEASSEHDPIISNVVYSVIYPMEDQDWVIYKKMLALFPLAGGLHETLSVGKDEFDKIDNILPKGQDLEKLLRQLVTAYGLRREASPNPWDAAPHAA